MKLCAVLAGCLVVACCTVNTRAELPCPENIVFVFDCLDNSNTAQWEAVKSYTKHIIQHMPGTADASTPRIGIFAPDGESNSTDDDTNLVSQPSDTNAKNKRLLMAFIDLIKTNRKVIQLNTTMYDILIYGILLNPDYKSKANSIVIIKDGSVTGRITTADGDAVYGVLYRIEGNPMVAHLIRINDAAEDANVKALIARLGKEGVYKHNHSLVDHPKSSYTDLTPADAFNFVKDGLHCDPFGKADDPLEASATGITLPPPPPTQQLPAAGSTSSYALSLTKTSAVVGLWSSVLIVTTAMSTF